jgi:hypothetical protein
MSDPAARIADRLAYVREHELHDLINHLEAALRAINCGRITYSNKDRSQAISAIERALDFLYERERQQ